MKTNDIPLKSPIKLQQEMQKKIWNFPKFVRFLGHFLKKQCFWKMGMAGIKQLLRPSKIASFLRNLNPIRYGGEPGRPGSQENPCGSLEVVSKLLKFLDFVPFNLSQVLVK